MPGITICFCAQSMRFQFQRRSCCNRRAKSSLWLACTTRCVILVTYRARRHPNNYWVRSFRRSVSVNSIMIFDEVFDVIVIGGGHAGCEAASAAARLGANTALVTINLDLIGQMSCNPAIGGIGKGHLVRQIDELGGIMGRVIDRTGIQFRLLNRSRGPAVQSPRAQADRALYRTEMRRVLEATPNLYLRQGCVTSLVIENKRV